MDDENDTLPSGIRFRKAKRRRSNFRVMQATEWRAEAGLEWKANSQGFFVVLTAQRLYYFGDKEW